MFRWLKSLVLEYGKRRDPLWPRVRAEHIRKNPSCACCGATENLEVHHVFPVWKYPHRELDTGNLLTMCGPPRDCHWSIGHGFNDRAYRPNVREVAAFILASRVVKPE